MREAVPINCNKEALIVSLSQASIECTILVKQMHQVGAFFNKVCFGACAPCQMRPRNTAKACATAK